MNFVYYIVQDVTNFHDVIFIIIHTFDPEVVHN